MVHPFVMTYLQSEHYLRTQCTLTKNTTENFITTGKVCQKPVVLRMLNYSWIGNNIRFHFVYSFCESSYTR